MKKYDLLKVLGITFLVVLLLSWVIPAGAYSNGVFKSLGSTATIGLYDLVRTPAITIATFIQYGLLFLAIGGFYGVLNKTGVYSNLVNKVTNKWKGSNKFIVITTILFALLSSLTALPNVLFILVPFFVAVLLKLGYSKMAAFASTVGALLVGQIGTTFGFNIWGYLANTLSLKMTTVIAARIILLVMITVLFILLIIKNTKKEMPIKETKKKKEDVKEEKILDIPLYEETTSKKGIVPLVVIGIFVVALLILGMYNWAYGVPTKIFTTLHDSITSFEISGFPIFASLLGNVSELGYWGNYDAVVILVLGSLLVGWLYNVKFKEIINGFAEGCKKMLPTALYAMLSCIVFASILNMSSGNFVNTIVDKFLSGSESFSFLGTVGSGLVASFTHNDFPTLMSVFGGAFAVYDAADLSIIAFLIQGIYGFVMLIAPTSIFLLAGLKYMEIPYKEWMKYIWKFALIIFGIVMVVGFILTMI